MSKCRETSETIHNYKMKKFGNMIKTDEDDKKIECVWVLGELKSVLGYNELGSAIDNLLDAN